MKGSGVVGLLGVVELIDDGLIWVRYVNGAYGPIDPDTGPDVELGAVVLVLDDRFISAPGELNRPSTPTVRIGVVRAVETERSLVEIDGGLRWLPHATKVAWDVWSTVEWDEDGIRASISKEPMRYRDDPPSSATVRSRFRVNPEDVKDKFDGIQGLDSQIAELRQIISMMHSAEELEQKGMRPVRGLLLAGESGTGKTMLARALANEAGAVYFHVRGPEIASKWVNESEEMLRALMDEADALPRAVVFFDEIDSLGGARSSSAHEMSNKLITQFLTLLDGFDEAPGRALIVGATNRPEALDPTLLRSGRFDRRINFHLPNAEAREAILGATRPTVADAGINLELLAERTETWCSADLRGLWTQAFQFAHGEGRETILELDCEVAIERIHPRVQERRALNAMDS